MRSGCTGRSCCPSVTSRVVATERLFLKTQDQCKQVYDIITEKLKPEQKTSAIILLMFTSRFQWAFSEDTGSVQTSLWQYNKKEIPKQKTTAIILLMLLRVLPVREYSENSSL